MLPIRKDFFNSSTVAVTYHVAYKENGLKGKCQRQLIWISADVKHWYLSKNLKLKYTNAVNSHRVNNGKTKTMVRELENNN